MSTDHSGPISTSDYGTSYRETETPVKACVGVDPELWALGGNSAYLTAGNKIAKRMCDDCPALDWCKQQIDYTDPPSGVIQAGRAWPVDRKHLPKHLRDLITPKTERPEATERWAAIRQLAHAGHSAQEIADKLGVSTRQVQRANNADPITPDARRLHAEFTRLTVNGRPIPEHVKAGERAYQRIKKQHQRIAA